MKQNDSPRLVRQLSKDKINFDELIALYTVSNQGAFFGYLNEIWRDLSNRNENPLYISKLIFSSYYDLPGIISERLFAVFDMNNDELLSRDEFLNGMKRLFTNDYDGLTKMIFELYDFDKNRLISKEDIRIVLSYVSLSKEELNEMNYIDRVHSQEELEVLLNESFLMFKSPNIDHEHFLDMIENFNSDVFFYIIMFLYSKQPFTKAVLKEYDNENKLTCLRTNYSTNCESMKNRKIASPNISRNFSPCSFLTAPRKHRSYQKNDVLSKFCENHTINSQKSFSKFIQFKTQKEDDVSPSIHILKKINQKFYNENENENDNSQSIYTEKISNDMSNTKKSLNTNFHDFGKRISKNLEEIPIDSSDSNEDVDTKLNYTKSNTSNSISNNNDIKKEGYLYTKKKDEFSQIYIKLIDKDMFIFNSSKAKHHLSMKNLNGIFIKTLEPLTHQGTIYYPFTLIFSSKHEIYYSITKIEYHEWVEMLNDITNCRNVNDAYLISEKKLGEGRSGKVYLGKHRLTGETVAIKIVDKQHLTIEEIQLVKTEIKILKICQHPNIIKLHEVFENDKNIYIIMENCSGGDLFSYLQKRNFKLSEKRACKLIHKICTAVFYIHSYGIVHRDVKPENILMTDDSNDADLRIVDFGLSKIIGPNQNISNELYGTISYAAPEVLNGQPYSKAVDIFSIGVLSYLFLSGDLPFEDKNEEEVTRKTISEPHSFNNNQIWQYITKEGKDFVNCCLEKDVAKRIDIKTALVHSWFKTYLKGSENRRSLNIKKTSSDFKLYSSTKELLKQYLDSE